MNWIIWYAKKGFTLIELLVVAILMLALGKDKELATSVSCLSSARQLTLAWEMYSEFSESTYGLPAACPPVGGRHDLERIQRSAWGKLGWN
ncbi:MAG: prepilin-type N-terminal cleavage/methylation domain-containing protein [Desulfobulbaceae bacterium]|nr:prepilin-type N-terminal cleavage/methylation domain-containing protein [Desulfobulbaceae bacterium]